MGLSFWSHLEFLVALHAQLLRHLVVALDGVEAALALPAADVGAGLDDVVVGDHDAWRGRAGANSHERRER